MFGMWFEFMFQRFICWNLDPHCSGNKPVWPLKIRFRGAYKVIGITAYRID
jgi:hypothetical protein